MAKVNRIQHHFDQELAEKGLKRIYRMEVTKNGQPVYREQIIKNEEYTIDRKPWWKQDTQKKKRSKPSKA